MTAPFDIIPDEGKKHAQINVYYFKKHYEKFPKTVELFSKLYEIMNEGNRTISEDADYGSIPQFYVDIEVGKWDKDFFVFK